MNCLFFFSLVCVYFIFFFLFLFRLTLTSSVQRKFAQGTNVTTGVVHGLQLCDMGENIVEEKKKL